MYRAIGMALVWAAPLVLAGCESGGGSYDDGYGGYYGFCRQFSSCDECTPIYGCGWCTYGSGKGICLEDPDECRTAQFTWTWEQKGCSAVTDGGTTPHDAGTSSSDSTSEGSTDDAAPE